MTLPVSFGFIIAFKASSRVLWLSLCFVVCVFTVVSEIDKVGMWKEGGTD